MSSSYLGLLLAEVALTGYLRTSALPGHSHKERRLKGGWHKTHSSHSMVGRCNQYLQEQGGVPTMLLTPVLLLHTVGGMHVSRKSVNSVSTCKHFSCLLLGGMVVLCVRKTHLVYRETLPGQECDTARQGD